jgi:hypothetical protein
VQITIERLVELITREVVEQLAQRGVDISGALPGTPALPVEPTTTYKESDFTGYKTPVLTEFRVRSVEPGVSEIRVPGGTVCTAGAKQLMRMRKITLRSKNPS